MALDDLSPDEKDLIKSLRRTRSSDALHTLDEAAFRERLKSRLGVTNEVADRSVTKMRRLTATFDGPRVVVSGTLDDLRVSWQQYLDELVRRGVSGDAIKNDRQALERYCRAAGLEWAPETSLYERRSRLAREARKAGQDLPDDFLDLLFQIVHEVRYRGDDASNAMYQHRARFNLKSGPRTPSEDTRFRERDCRFNRGSVFYQMSKVGGPEGEAVLVPREVYGLEPNVLTSKVHKTPVNWLTSWRPRIMNGPRVLPEAKKHDYVWVGQNGLPLDPDHYRLHFATCAKAVWPGFYAYLTREIAIIVHAVENLEKTGTTDIDETAQWAGHSSLDTTRRYMRKGRSLFRRLATPTERRDFLSEWRSI